MEKRAILFIVVTMMLLVVFQYLQPVPQPVNAPSGLNNTATAQTPQAVVPAAHTAPATVASDTQATVAATAPVAVPEQPEALVTVKTDLYTAVFSTRGGTLRSFELTKYQAEDGSPVSLLQEGALMRTLAIGVGDDYSISERNFNLLGDDIEIAGEGESASLTFSYSDASVSIKRIYTFNTGTYTFEVEDSVSGLPHYQITLGTDFGLFERTSAYTHVGPVLLSGADREEFKFGKVKAAETFTDNIKWIAMEDKYFVGAIVPRDPVTQAFVWPSSNSTAISLRAAPGTHRLTVYGGPKEHDGLIRVGGDLKYIVDFGVFSIIARPIFWLLKQIYAVIGNYGFAIILLTIIIRVPFIPLVSKGQKSMKKLQELQPRMNDIRQQYKNDPDRMNKEIMGLYSKHKVNPVGGCLPLVLQIPVFFALYKVLMITIELRGAPFIFWIHDLSIKDPTYILPIVMGATMFIQQKMTPTGGDPKHQKILMWMPVVFTFISLNFPSGLVLYWMVNNFLSIGQQSVVNKSKD